MFQNSTSELVNHEVVLRNCDQQIASMQPYFLPYLGYFSLIKLTDKFIISDEPQMINDGWVHRNRVLKPIEGWYYIRIPLIKYHYTTPIKNIMINNSEDWKRRIIDQLGHYKKIAPYYFSTVNILKKVFENEFVKLVELNVALLEAVCEYLQISFNYEILSETDIDLSSINEPDEWGLVICKEIGCHNYLNPVGGKNIYDTCKYEENEVQINFIRNKLPVYKQKNCSFTQGLSIVDVMMFNPPEEINMMLDDIQLL